MKIFFKKLLLIIFACIIPIHHTNCFINWKNLCNKESAAYLLATTSGIAITWALLETYKKSNLYQKFNKIKQELENYKNETVQLSKDEKLLSSAESFIEKIKHNLENELNLISNSNINSEVMHNNPNFIANICNTVLNRLKNGNSDVFHTKKVLNETLKHCINVEKKLGIKLLYWKTKENRKKHVEKARTILSNLNTLTNSLKILEKIINQQQFFINLSQILDQNFEIKYSREINLSSISEEKLYQKEVDKLIKSLYSDSKNQFPYLAYASALKIDKERLEKSLNKISNANQFNFQINTIERAESLFYVLKKTFEHIVTSEIYLKEKKEMPEFEKQQAQFYAELNERKMRLEAELREKEAKIKQNAQLIQARLTAEKNKAQELENQKAKIERDKKDLEVKEKETMLEWARIRDGKTIEEAINKNDSKWQSKLYDIESRYNQLKKEANLKSDEIKKLRIELSNLKSELKNEDFNNEKNTQEIEKLKNKIKVTQKDLSNLINEFNYLPFNPHMSNDLNNFLLDLKYKLESIKTTLA